MTIESLRSQVEKLKEEFTIKACREEMNNYAYLTAAAALERVLMLIDKEAGK